MKRETSWTAAVLLAIAAFFGLSQHSDSPSLAAGPPASSSATKATRFATSYKAQIAGQVPSNPCQNIESMLRNFYPLKDISSASADVVYPEVCEDSWKSSYERQSIIEKKTRDGVTFEPTQKPLPHKQDDMLWNKTRSTKFVIATLPDPEKTHLTLIFDRLIVAIQHATQDECLTYDSSWLPWHNGNSEYTSLLDDEQAKQNHEVELHQPGILLFRENVTSGCELERRQNLIIFVVGETPTGGIDKEQFLSAVSWIESLSDIAADPSRPFTLNLLGPYSSGSFESLQKLIDLVPRAGPLYIDVSTGTTTADQMISGFQGSPFLISSFADFVEKDRAAIGRFLCALHENGYDVGKVATLSEDETAYGASLTDATGNNSLQLGSCDPERVSLGLRLSYPRNISVLRSEYEKTALLTPSSATEAKTAAMLRVLPTTILGDEESRNQSDTVASYSGKQEPLSEEAEVLEIVDVLRAKHIEYILLSGSNPMDTIFLAQFLRRAYPEGRVVMSGSDTLLFRGRGQDSLDGVLTLSVYPLINEAQDWTTGPQQVHEGFSSDAAEGEYNAARHLMHTVLLHTVHPFGLPNYSTPDWLFDNPKAHPDRDIPPVWLSVVSANRAWPVEAYPAQHLDESLLHSTRFDQHSFEGSEPPPLKTPRPVCTPDLPTGFIPLACTPLCFALWYGYRCLSNREMVGPRQHIFIVLAWFCVAVIAIVPAIFSGLPWELFHHTCGSGRDLIVRLFPMLLAMLVATGFPMVHVILRPHFYVDAIQVKNTGLESVSRVLKRIVALRKSKRLCAIALLPIILSIAVTAWGWLLVVSLHPEHRELMFWRGLSMFSGVSPSAPVVAFAVGGFIWCVKSQNAVRLLRADRPQLPEEKHLGSHLLILSETPYIRLKSTGSYAPWKLRLRLLLVIAASIFLVNRYGLERYYGHLRTLEPMSFTHSYEILFWLAATLVLSEGILVRIAWITLRPLLSALSAIPLRRTLISLKEIRWKTLWSVSDGGSCRRFLPRLWEASSHLAASLPSKCPAAKRHDLLYAACNSVDACFCELHRRRTGSPEDTRSPESVALAAEMQRQCAATAGFLMQELLMPAWQQEKHSLIIHEGAASANEDQAPPLLSGCECVRNAEEFVCLVYLSFIQNVLARFRFIVVGALAVYLSMVAAAALLMFDPRPAMSAALLLLFLAFSAPVVSVFWQMHRNETLSYITNTKPGELGAEFWVHAIAFASGPILALIAIAFPELSSWLFSFLQSGSS
jgi:hypothetical protein